QLAWVAVAGGSDDQRHAVLAALQVVPVRGRTRIGVQAGVTHVADDADDGYPGHAWEGDAEAFAEHAVGVFVRPHRSGNAFVDHAHHVGRARGLRHGSTCIFAIRVGERSARAEG